MDKITNTLEERGKRYGAFDGHAYITQVLKVHMAQTENWQNMLTDSMREALDMIAHKIGRILNGDPFYADSWVDIAGYATLVAQKLEKEAKPTFKRPRTPLEEVIDTMLDELHHGRQT